MLMAVPVTSFNRQRLIWPALVLAVAAALRFIGLDRPDTLVFDELFYVRDAISQLTHGFATTWPDSDPDMSGARATAFSDEASYVAHPPLGKWLISLGVLLFGPETGWGWRTAVAFSGVLTVAATMRLGWLMSRSLLVACLAGLFLAFDGVHVVLSRVALLDGFLTLAIVLGALCMWRDHLTSHLRSHRWWLVLAGVAFGAAAAVKWSGLYALAGFALFTVVRDFVRARRAPQARPVGGALLVTLLNALRTAALMLPAAALTYLASWSGWIFTTGGWGREGTKSWIASLADYHTGLLAWHASLTAEHPFQSHPLGWPLGLRPTAMYFSRWSEGAGCPWSAGCIAGITPVPNVFVTWGGLLALIVLLVAVIKAARRVSAPSPLASAGAFVLVGYLSGWLPWVFTFSRSAVFQFYTVVLTPFSSLALALMLGVIVGVTITSAAQPNGAAAQEVPGAPQPSFTWSGSFEEMRGRRWAVTLFTGGVVGLGLWFFPLWSAVPVSQWFWDLHRWLPGWA